MSDVSLDEDATEVVQPPKLGGQQNGFELHLDGEDAALLMNAFANKHDRVQKVDLSSCAVWIKRQGTQQPSWGSKALSLMSRFLPYAFMRPSPLLDPAGMIRRETESIRKFNDCGFPVPQIVYSSPTAVILTDVGLTIAQRLDRLEIEDIDAHEDLMISVASGLGDLHAAGLCHGRPHIRDFFVRDGQIGFLDFEEEPSAVMPLSTAQARDLWLLFLPLTHRSLRGEPTLHAAYQAWETRAPANTITELRRMVSVLGKLLPLARFIARIHMGSDLKRFILATDFLKNTLASTPSVTQSKAGKRY